MFQAPYYLVPLNIMLISFNPSSYPWLFYIRDSSYCTCVMCEWLYILTVHLCSVYVVSHVYRLALLDFTNSKLSTLCAAFVEMLDRDSTLLRVDTQAALPIARYSGEEDGRGM